MKWLVVPVDELKRFDNDWECRRKSIDGTKAIIHESIYNKLVPPAVTIPEVEDEYRDVTYPFPLLDEHEVRVMLDTDEWSEKLILN